MDISEKSPKLGCEGELLMYCVCEGREDTEGNSLERERIQRAEC